MGRRAKMALLVLLLAMAPLRLAAETPAQKPSPEDLARQMIEVTGGAEMAKQVMQQMVDIFRQQDASVPGEFWDELMASVDTKRLIDMTIPIYVRNLTVEEMTAAIEFYSSPAGRSLTRKLPAIVQESMSAGQAWGEDLARDIVERLTKYKQARRET